MRPQVQTLVRRQWNVPSFLVYGSQDDSPTCFGFLQGARVNVSTIKTCSRGKNKKPVQAGDSFGRWAGVCGEGRM